MVLSSPAATPAALAFATDVLPGTQVMDVDEAESRFDSLRDECLSFAPRLFVEDGALGGSREAEIRVRVITDSPAVALFARSALLQRIPLYAPEVFPRTITLYAASLASPHIEAGRVAATGAPAPPYTLVDVDPAAARACVAAVGAVSFAALRSALGLAASQLMTSGGYRSVPGGEAQNPNLAEARSDGILSWYARDGHWYAPPGTPHPDLLALPGADVIAATAGSAAPALVLGSHGGAVASAAAAAGRLYAAHGAVWTGSGTVTSLWGGATLPAGSAGAGKLASAAGGRGVVTAQGGVSAPLAGARALKAPGAVLVIDPSASSAAAAGSVSGADAVARVRAVAPLSDKQAEKLAARLTGVAVTVVKTEAEALQALQLA